MQLTKSIATLWLCLTILPAGARAATLLSVSNGDDFSFLSGSILRGPSNWPNPNFFRAVQWTQTVAANNVQIRAAVVEQDSWLLDAYITTALGPLTTPADVVASSTVDVKATPPIDFFAAPPMVTLFTGLNLNPGTYYLVLATSVLSETSAAWVGDPQAGATITSAPGFSLGGAYEYAEDLYVPFHPSSRFIQVDQMRGLFWDLTTPAEVPEPGTLSLLAAGSVLLAMRRGKTSRVFRSLSRRSER